MKIFNRFSGRRFFNELRLILSEENPLPALYRLDRYKLLHFLHPPLKLDQKLKKILKETHRSIAWYRLLYLDEPCQQWLVFLLALLSKLSTKQTLKFCQKFEVTDRHLRFVIKEKVACSKIIKVLKQRPFDVEILQDKKSLSRTQVSKSKKQKGPPMRPSEIYWLLHGVSNEGLLYLMGITSHTSAKKAISLYVTKLCNINTYTKGDDLKKMHYTPGPLFGTILNHLLEAKLDGILSSKKDEKEFIKEHYPQTIKS